MMNKLVILALGIILTGCSLSLDTKKEVPGPELSFPEIQLEAAYSHSGKFYTKLSTVNIFVAASGYKQISVSNDATCSAGSWVSVRDPLQLAVTSINGLEQVFSVQFRNDTSTISACKVFQLIKDSVAPSAATISIHADAFSGGIEYVKTGDLTVNFTALDALPVETRISTQASCSDGSWKDYAAFELYSPVLAHGNNLRLYAQFRDKLGNVSACISSNEVRRDSQGPVVDGNSLKVTGLPVSDPVLVYSQTVSLSLSATDPLLSEMKISGNANCSGGTFVPYTATSPNWDLGATAGAKPLSVIFQDRLGNTSSCTTINLSYSATGPQGALAVQGALTFNSKKYISSASATLNLTYANATEMNIFSDGVCSTSANGWEAVAATSPFNFTGSDGTKAVSVQFRNSGGAQISSCLAAEVILDTTAPTAADAVAQTEFVAAGINYTKQNSVIFDLSAVDLSLKDYEVTSGASCGDGSTKQVYTATRSMSVAGADGLYSFSFQFFDVFGVASSCVTVGIVKDTTAGATPSFASLYSNTGGSLKETPRIYLEKSSEERNSTSRSGVNYYEAQIEEQSGGAVIMAWKNVGNFDSFVISGLSEDLDHGQSLHNGFVMTEGTAYQLKLRSVDNLGHTSGLGTKVFTAKPAPVQLTSLENVTINQLQTQEFVAVGVGAGVLAAVSSGAKICKVPCDVVAAGVTSLTLTEGDRYKVGLQSSATASSLKQSILTIGQSGATQVTSHWNVSTGNFCPTGYLFVPADQVMRTQAFCIAKFEMKDVSGVATSQASGTIWTGVTRAESETACGTDAGRLPSNSEWNAVARNIAQVTSNWKVSNDGDLLQVNLGLRGGSGIEDVADESNHCINTSDSPCTSSEWKRHKRTHKLSTGEFIWDFSGNAWEAVSGTFLDNVPASNVYLTNLTTTSVFNHYLGRPTDFVCYQPYNDDYCGFGYGWLSSADSGIQAIYRGGSYNNGIDAGLFTADFDYDDTQYSSYHSFRCVKSIQ